MYTRKRILTSFLGALLSLAFVAPSHALRIDSVGTWSNPAPTGVTDLEISPSGETISWGDPATTAGKSSYTFIGESGSQAFLDGSAFSVGTFTHNNFPIYGTPLTAVDLLVNIDFLDDDLNTLSVSEVFNFTFGHNETPNRAKDCPNTLTVCPDVVSIPTTASSGMVELFGYSYSLDFVGFLVGGVGTPVSQFITEERYENSAEIMAKLTRVSVSEPATISLMALSLFGLAALRRRARS